MKHPSSLKLHGYWLSCRGAMGVSASAIRAAELAPIVPALFLFDLNGAGASRFRFCGEAIARRFGRDLTDEDFLGLWTGEDRALLAGHLRTIAAHSIGLVAGVVGETLGGGATAFEMLILPLEGQTAAAGAIGSMVRVGGHEETNRLRARLTAQSLRSVRFLAATARTASADLVPSEPTNGTGLLAEMRAAAAPGDIRKRYRHLSVVPGGRAEAAEVAGR